MAKEYDLVILGGGIGGYTAAIRATQLGFKTAIVENHKLGGTCLHYGCIPTKTWLQSAGIYRMVRNSGEFGIITEDPVINFSAVRKRTASVINRLHRGLELLIKKRKIDVYHGYGRILGPSIFSPLAGTISIETDDPQKTEMLIPKFLLIATGSERKNIPGLEVDGEYIFSSMEMLELNQLPRSIMIIGGGVIGTEWASLLADFNVNVSIIEQAERILPFEDEEISAEISSLFAKKGIQIYTNAKVLPDTLEKGNGVSVQIEKEGITETVEAEKMLISTGRTGKISGIGLENTNIETDGNFIKVNPYYQTKETYIYAIGDCIGGLQLAHVAAKEGITAVEHMAGKDPQPLDYTMVPRCIYSHPEIAAIGLTETEAKKKYNHVKISKIPFQAVGKAVVEDETNGFIKMITDAETEDLLGVHIIGSRASELISEASLAKFLDATADEIAYTIHPHPTLSEIFPEAGLQIDGKAIHI